MDTVKIEDSQNRGFYSNLTLSMLFTAFHIPKAVHGRLEKKILVSQHMTIIFYFIVVFIVSSTNGMHCAYLKIL